MRRRSLLKSAAALVAFAVAACAAPASTARKHRRIGFLSGNVRGSVEIRTRVLMDELDALGYEDGRDVSLVYRLAENDNERLPQMAEELVAMPVDLIFAEGGAAQFAAKAATMTIPIVLGLGPDPEPAGLVESVARPGGNITGVSILNNATMGKKLELLREVSPRLSRVAIIHNANNATIDSARYGQQVGRVLGLDIQIFGAKDLGQLGTVLDEIADARLEAIATTALLSVVRADLGAIPRFAGQRRMPQVFSDIEIARAGGLLYYNVDFADLYRAAARMIDKIFKGTSPADLPIHEPTELDLAVNLAAAERMGLAIPDVVLRRAKELIR